MASQTWITSNKKYSTVWLFRCFHNSDLQCILTNSSCPNTIIIWKPDFLCLELELLRKFTELLHNLNTKHTNTGVGFMPYLCHLSLDFEQASETKLSDAIQNPNHCNVWFLKYFWTTDQSGIWIDQTSANNSTGYRYSSKTHRLGNNLCKKLLKNIKIICLNPNSNSTYIIAITIGLA